MRTLLRRLGCALGLLAWLALLLLPCLAFGLALRHELAWERGPDTRDRLYLIQAADATGLGYSSTRPHASASPGATCALTVERLWLWYPAWRADTFSACTCSAAAPGGGRTPLGDCAP